MSRAPHALYSPSKPSWAAGRPLALVPETYPLVNELELQVALTAVWVGLRAGLQRVPLILPAAQVLGQRRPRP